MDPAIAPGAPAHAHGVHGVDGPAGARPRPWGRLGGLAALAGVTAYVGTVDPSGGGAFVRCPSQLLFGIDCPACGGLRGTHDLLRGDVVGALDHNLLLPLWLGLYAVLIGAWLLPLIGRHAPAVRPPRWLVVAGLVVAVGFTVLRNLPIAGLEFLAADA
jgi:hypothetical protein